MSVENLCEVCDRPTRSVTRHWCERLTFHVICDSCAPIVTIKERRYNGEPLVICPEIIDDAVRTMAALREPEKIPADPGDQIAEIFRKSLSAAIHTVDVADKLKSAVEGTSISTAQLSAALTLLSRAMKGHSEGGK